MSVDKTHPLVQLWNLDPTPADVQRFIGPLSTYRSLHELVLLNQFTVKDLKLMLIIELRGQRRSWMARRLAQHIARTEYAHIKKLTCLSLGCSVESLFS